MLDEVLEGTLAVGWLGVAGVEGAEVGVTDGVEAAAGSADEGAEGVAAAGALEEAPAAAGVLEVAGAAGAEGGFEVAGAASFQTCQLSHAIYITRSAMSHCIERPIGRV